jgi:hypothetical protein
MITVLQNVYHVVINVLTVKSTLANVLNVLKTECQILHLAHVMMDGMNPMENVKNVLSDVKNVPFKLKIVILVLLTESLPQLVDVHLDIMMITHLLNAHYVNTLVSLVLHMMYVPNVNLVEFKFQTVNVQLDNGMMVLLNVKYVHSNVQPVKMMLKTVTLVPVTELMLHFVIVHLVKVTMKLLMKLGAQNVLHNV